MHTLKSRYTLRSKWCATDRAMDSLDSDVTPYSWGITMLANRRDRVCNARKPFRPKPLLWRLSYLAQS